MHGEDRPNIKTQLIIGALKFAEVPDHILNDYVLYNGEQTTKTTQAEYAYTQIYTCSHFPFNNI